MKKVFKNIFEIYNMLIKRSVAWCGLCTALLGVVIYDNGDIPKWSCIVIIWLGFTVAFDAIIRELISDFKDIPNEKRIGKKIIAKFKRGKSLKERLAEVNNSEKT